MRTHPSEGRFVTRSVSLARAHAKINNPAPTLLPFAHALLHGLPIEKRAQHVGIAHAVGVGQREPLARCVAGHVEFARQTQAKERCLGAFTQGFGLSQIARARRCLKGCI